MLGAMGALLAALLLEGAFAWTQVGRYFYEQAAEVVMFRHTVERATRDRLGTGDVQLTLRWSSHNDLDLYCVDPYGQTIYFRNHQVAGGGRLDLDMNAGAPPWTQQAVENIYWPSNAAPQGEYRVMVHHYRRNNGPTEAPFWLRILHKGRVEYRSGVVPYHVERPHDWNEPLDPVNPAEPQEVFRFNIDTPPPTVAGQRPIQWVAILVAALWVGAVSGGLTSAILGGLNRWYEAQAKSGQQKNGLVGADQAQQLSVKAVWWGTGYGALAQIGFGLLAAVMPFALEVWRWVAWIMLATWTGKRAGLIVPRHLPPDDSRLGGRRGGVSGGLGFIWLVVGGSDSLFYGADASGRLLAALLIGGCIGWMVQLPVLEASDGDTETSRKQEQQQSTHFQATTHTTTRQIEQPTAREAVATSPTANAPSTVRPPHDPNPTSHKIPSGADLSVSSLTEETLELEGEAETITESGEETVSLTSVTSSTPKAPEAAKPTRIVRSRGGRPLTQRGLGGPRQLSGGRRVQTGRDRSDS
jgi:hypothetical protein